MLSVAATRGADLLLPRRGAVRATFEQSYDADALSPLHSAVLLNARAAAAAIIASVTPARARTEITRRVVLPYKKSARVCDVFRRRLGSATTSDDVESLAVSCINIAVDAAYPGMAKLLLTAGGNANESDATQKPVLAHALSSAENGVGQHAFGYAELRGAHAEGDEAAAMSIGERFARRFSKIARKLVRFGASCTVVDAYGWAPIHYAAKCSDAKIVRMIAERAGAASVASPVRQGLAMSHSIGMTALHLTVQQYNGFFDRAPMPPDRAEKLKVLLELGAAAALDAVADGRTALEDAADLGDVECVEMLVAAGAVATHCDSDGKTAADLLAPHAARRGATAAQAALRKLRQTALALD